MKSLEQLTSIFQDGQSGQYNISMESDRGTSKGAYTNGVIYESVRETKVQISDKTPSNDNASDHYGRVS